MNMGLTSIFSERRLSGRISSEQFGRNPELELKNTDNGFTVSGHIVDISATGVRVITGKALARGQMLALEHKGNARITNRAVVIWSLPVNDGCFQSGLQLLKIDEY